MNKNYLWKYDHDNPIIEDVFNHMPYAIMKKIYHDCLLPLLEDGTCQYLSSAIEKTAHRWYPAIAKYSFCNLYLREYKKYVYFHNHSLKVKKNAET